jgi:hypothetical protein
MMNRARHSYGTRKIAYSSARMATEQHQRDENCKRFSGKHALILLLPAFDTQARVKDTIRAGFFQHCSPVFSNEQKLQQVRPIRDEIEKLARTLLSLGRVAVEDAP